MFEVFKDYPDLLVAFSEKRDGDMKLGDSLDETARENRRRFFRKSGVDPKDVVTNGLVQEDRVRVVSENDRGRILSETDGSLTQAKGIFLSITAADCLPVFFYDPAKEVGAIAHAGWRGLAKGILPKVVRKMREEFQSGPSDIRAGIGPGIGGCHYDIREDVAEHFKGFSSAIIRREGKIFLDLKKIAALQLRQADMLPGNLEISALCTYCEKDRYFSWRRDKAKISKVQAMLAFIGMKE